MSTQGSQRSTPPEHSTSGNVIGVPLGQYRWIFAAELLLLPAQVARCRDRCGERFLIQPVDRRGSWLAAGVFFWWDLGQPDQKSTRLALRGRRWHWRMTQRAAIRAIPTHPFEFRASDAYYLHAVADGRELFY